MKIDIEDYYNKYAPGVFRRCFSLLKDEESAYDAMQEVFIKLIEKKERLYDKYPSTLLFKMATNICLNIIRDERNDIAVDNDILAKIAGCESFESRFMARDLLDRIFSNEKKDTKTIAVIHFIDKMTYNEISAELGLSVSGIRKRLARLKDKIKHLKEDLS